jgi:hypothetical protein
LALLLALPLTLLYLLLFYLQTSLLVSFLPLIRHDRLAPKINPDYRRFTA